MFVILAATGLVAVCASAQSVLFDFDNAPARAPLPITLTVGGLTAVFSGTGQGYSIQAANALGFTPAGFAGNCVYPSSIYAADLLVSFSRTITNFSILYAPEEYACDSSATMRVTAYLDGAVVGTATTNAQAGTWPSETLAFGSVQGFNRVVVHYAAAPSTGGDYGPVFMADNMMVALAPMPIVLERVNCSVSAGFQFSFTNVPGGSFSVLAATDLMLPQASWTLLGGPVEVAPGQYQFTDPSPANVLQRFYCVRSP